MEKKPETAIRQYPRDEKSPQKLAAERKRAEERAEKKRRHEAALKAAEKRAETAEDVSKKVRSQVADAIALTHMPIGDKQSVAGYLCDAFNLRGDERDAYIFLVSRHHTEVGETV